MQKVHVQVSIQRDLETVFAAISNHESFLSGGGLTCTLVQQGKTHKNGVGAIRHVQSQELTLVEHITEFENLLKLAYKIETTKPKKPLKHHKGWIDFRFSDGQTHVNWHSHFEITTPLIGWLLGFFVKKQVSKVFQSRLNFTKKQLEQSKPTN